MVELQDISLLLEHLLHLLAFSTDDNNDNKEKDKNPLWTVVSSLHGEARRELRRLSLERSLANGQAWSAVLFKLAQAAPTDIVESQMLDKAGHGSDEGRVHTVQVRHKKTHSLCLNMD